MICRLFHNQAISRNCFVHALDTLKYNGESVKRRRAFISRLTKHLPSRVFFWGSCCRHLNCLTEHHINVRISATFIQAGVTMRYVSETFLIQLIMICIVGGGLARPHISMILLCTTQSWTATVVWDLPAHSPLTALHRLSTSTVIKGTLLS